MAKTRIKIPKKIEDDVMYKSRGNCYCGKRGDEIHHIDKDPSNNDFDNLVLLCHDHHDEASVTNGLKKRLSPSQIKKRRDELYKQNEEKSRMELKHYSTTLKKVTDENLYRASLDAAITLEIIKIRQEYNLEPDWEKRSEILWKLRIYNEHSDIRISHEIIEFLSRASDYARAGMPVEVADAILNVILEYFPYPENPKDKKLTLKIAETCGHIAFGIAYDSFIHLGNLAVAGSGLEILKYLYSRGKDLKIKELSEIALKQYTELERTLQRPERTDLENAKRLLKVYKEDLDKHGLSMPDDIPEDLYHIMVEHRKASHQRIRNQEKAPL
jgi:hypothetical protein